MTNASLPFDQAYNADTGRCSVPHLHHTQTQPNTTKNFKEENCVGEEAKTFIHCI